MLHKQKNNYPTDQCTQSLTQKKEVNRSTLLK